LDRFARTLPPVKQAQVMADLDDALKASEGLVRGTVELVLLVPAERACACQRERVVP
jgi:hypothetical protein